MATVNFLYRSTRPEAAINLRLLYRVYDDSYKGGHKDYVIGGRTQLKVSKHYWDNEHFKLKFKDIEKKNRKKEIDDELYKIENYILDCFNKTPLTLIDKKWLRDTIHEYYNPKESAKHIHPMTLSITLNTT